MRKVNGREITGDFVDGKLGSGLEPPGGHGNQTSGKKLTEDGDFVPMMGVIEGMGFGAVDEDASEFILEDLLDDGVAGVQEKLGILFFPAQEVVEELSDRLLEGDRVGGERHIAGQNINEFLKSEGQQMALVLEMGIKSRAMDFCFFANILHSNFVKGFFMKEIRESDQQQGVGALDTEVTGFVSWHRLSFSCQGSGHRLLHIILL